MSQHESSSTDETFGALVRTHRDALSLTQQALARACQLSPVYISQIEKGVALLERRRVNVKSMDYSK